MKKKSLRFDIVTLFPHSLDSYINESILGRARKEKKIQLYFHDMREFGKGRYRHVDDTPYGGGAGMIISFDVIYKTLKKLRPYGSQAWKKFHKMEKSLRTEKSARALMRTGIFLLAANGDSFNQKTACHFVKKYDRIILICGRYEGVDHRIYECIDGAIRIGDYVMTGGELGAAVIVDVMARLVPGVLGEKCSLDEESHGVEGYLEYPQYTKPAEIKIGNKKLSVPDVLLSGDHAKIKKWREENRKNKETVIFDANRDNKGNGIKAKTLVRLIKKID